MKYQPGAVDIKGLSLFNHKGQEVSILEQSLDLNIFSSFNTISP